MSTRPCTVGLTGGLASGKSTVAAKLEALGAECFDCDAYVHELYAPGGAGAADVAFLFGAAFLTEAGAVDRDALARVVLADAERRARLEGAIHPLVRSGVESWLATLSPAALAVVEAALMIETGSSENYDLVAVVWCEPDQQLARALARGVPPERARGLIAAQMPLAEKRERADIVIDNSGPPSALDAEVERAWREIVTRCREQRGQPDT